MRRGTPSVVRIHWKRYSSYEAAQNCHCVVYLFEGEGRPLYWGKADRSFFGGPKRTLGQTTACGRYGPSYDHLVTAFLKLGGRLYIGNPTLPNGVTLDDVEDFFIVNCPPAIPAEPPKLRLDLLIENTGARPAWLPRTCPSPKR